MENDLQSVISLYNPLQSHIEEAVRSPDFPRFVDAEVLEFAGSLEAVLRTWTVNLYLGFDLVEATQSSTEALATVTNVVWSPSAVCLRFNRMLEPAPTRPIAKEPCRGATVDLYLRTTQVTWMEFGYSMGLDEME